MTATSNFPAFNIHTGLPFYPEELQPPRTTAWEVSDPQAPRLLDVNCWGAEIKQCNVELMRTNVELVSKP